ncbi:MAG: hypothetical protein QY306_02395 [Anaerolineales bacterium]|nr:MAG: hypothetical protein QY306_02395 [Anaerolineales bacterium]
MLVEVNVFVDVGKGVCEGVNVKVDVLEGVGVIVGEGDAVAVGVNVCVEVGSGVCEGVNVDVGVLEDVGVGALVFVG